MNHLSEPIKDPVAGAPCPQGPLPSKSANHYQTIFKVSGQAVVVFRLGRDHAIGPIIEANDIACELSGFGRDELIGMDPARLVEPGTDFTGELEKLLARGRLITEEVVVLRDGRHVPIEIIAHAIEFADEPAVMVICRDVSKRREVESALHQSEERFRCIFDQAPVGMALADADGQLLLVNRALLDMLGHGLGTLLWMSIPAITYEPDREAQQAQYGRLCRGEIPSFNQELRFIRHDGGPIWVRLTCSAVYGNSGMLANVIAVIENISQQKAAQEALAAEHELAELERRRLRAVLDILPVGVIIAGADGKLIEVNQAAHAIWECPDAFYNWPEEHERYFRAWTPGTNQRLTAEEFGLMRALRSGESFEGVELEIETQDGRRKQILAYAVPIRDQAGRIMGAVAVHIDISQRREFLEKMRELNETLEQRVLERTAVAEQRATQLRALAFELTRAEQRERRRIAQMLHDHHQQLLVAAKLSLSMLHRRVQKPELRPIFQRIVELLDQSIDGLRSLTVELSPTILHDAGLAAALEWLARHKKTKYNLDVEVELDHDAEPPSEEIGIFVFQAVRELLFNIVKHAQVSEAKITLEPENDDFIRITVSDKGVGFDPKKVSARGGNEGFGLFSLRERVEMIGGHVVIDSTPGEGTRVAMIVPRTSSHDQAPCVVPGLEATIQNLSEGKGRTRVLLVDDHEILREGMVALLHEYPDMEVIGEASDGILAIEMARHTQPDVVIMDVAMPRLDGIEATRRIKAMDPSVQIIGLSMYGEENMADTMRSAGASAYLPKGCPADLLIATIRRCAPSQASA
ncbi:PAS domain S-box protein [bacterium]|nr:PAS domain S-box protein [bacterium]